MKNIIEIDVKNAYYFTVKSVNDGTNSIMVRFKNHSNTGRCEIYHGDLYHTEIQVDENGMITVPDQAYMDAGLTHLRYENGVTTCFLHLTGNGSEYKNLIVEQVSGCVAKITGDADDHITDYEIALAGIISNHTKRTSENCYKDLNEYRNALIISLNSAGTNLQTNSTVNDIAVAAKDLNTDIEKLAQIISEGTDGKIKECYKDLNEYRKDMIESLNKSGADISENANIEAVSEQVKAENIEITKGKEEIADAITSKGIETTSKDSLSNMAGKIKQIQTAGYGVSGYIDTTIETSGEIFAIYGLYTVEEQEAS